MSTPHFERIWWDRGYDLGKPISIWRPVPRPGFAPLADCITEGFDSQPVNTIFSSITSLSSYMWFFMVQVGATRPGIGF